MKLMDFRIWKIFRTDIKFIDVFHEKKREKKEEKWFYIFFVSEWMQSAIMFLILECGFPTTMSRCENKNKWML